MPNLTCVWRRLLWHNAVIFILTEAAVQLCRSLLVCIFKSVLIIISIFLFGLMCIWCWLSSHNMSCLTKWWLPKCTGDFGLKWISRNAFSFSPAQKPTHRGVEAKTKNIFLDEWHAKTLWHGDKMVLARTCRPPTRWKPGKKRETVSITVVRVTFCSVSCYRCAIKFISENFISQPNLVWEFTVNAWKDFRIVVFIS